VRAVWGVGSGELLGSSGVVWLEGVDCWGVGGGVVGSGGVFGIGEVEIGGNYEN